MKAVEQINKMRGTLVDLQHDRERKWSSSKSHQECVEKEKDKDISYLLSSRDGLERELVSCRNEVEVLQNEMKLKEEYYTFEMCKCYNQLDYEKSSSMVE